MATSFGNSRHQTVLNTIRDVYAKDLRVRQLILFGSLSRGNWDAHSDLDLDVIMADGVPLDARVELEQLCAAMAEVHGYSYLIVANREEGDVVLSNLVEFSIRYHPLHDTKPAILESMQTVHGDLTAETIVASANPAHAYRPPPFEQLINRYIRYLLGLQRAILRGHVWMAQDMLHRLRGLLMQMDAVKHGALRSVQHFDSRADAAQQKLLSRLVVPAEITASSAAFYPAVALLDQHLDVWCGDGYAMTAAQRQIIDRLKQLPLYSDSR